MPFDNSAFAGANRFPNLSRAAGAIFTALFAMQEARRKLKVSKLARRLAELKPPNSASSEFQALVKKKVTLPPSQTWQHMPAAGHPGFDLPGFSFCNWLRIRLFKLRQMQSYHFEMQRELLYCIFHACRFALAIFRNKVLLFSPDLALVYGDLEDYSSAIVAGPWIFYEWYRSALCPNTGVCDLQVSGCPKLAVEGEYVVLCD